MSESKSDEVYWQAVAEVINRSRTMVEGLQGVPYRTAQQELADTYCNPPAGVQTTAIEHISNLAGYASILAMALFRPTAAGTVGSPPSAAQVIEPITQFCGYCHTGYRTPAEAAACAEQCRAGGAEVRPAADPFTAIVADMDGCGSDDCVCRTERS